MRLSLSILALLAASPSFAEDFLVRADIAEATVYANGAEVTRRIELELPAGEHRVMFPTGEAWSDLPPIVSAPQGLRIGEVELVSNVRVDDGELDSAEQADARAAVERARDAVEDAQADLQAAAGAIRAAELQQAYLQAIVRGGEDGVAMPEDAAAMAAIIATLGGEMARADAELHDARQAQAELQDALQDRVDELAQAERALADLQPHDETIDLWSVTVTLAEAQTVTLDVTEFADAGWRPTYEAHLDSDTGELILERQVLLGARGSLPWHDVAVTLSTADPNRRRDASAAWPSLAQIFESRPVDTRSMSDAYESSVGALSTMAPAPQAEPAVIMEDRAASVFVDGLSLIYELPELVTIGPEGGVFLPFGEIELEADLINRAVPRYDATAYLIADVENTAGEPILPGDTRFFRDGALIGEGHLGFIPAGAEAELPFGPLDHIQLTWTDLSRDTGDRGVFVNSNIEQRRVMVSAENNSGEPVEIELLYATPFSEQEDLEVEVATSMSPDDRAWEDRRGVYAWELELASGAEAEIELVFDFDWPDDHVLDWRP